MTEQQLRKGLFRLWIVASVCWVCYMGLDIHGDYMEYRKWHSEYIANFRQNLDNFSDVLIEENEKYEQSRLWHAIAMFAVPIGVYFITNWIIKGFKKSN